MLIPYKIDWTERCKKIAKNNYGYFLSNYCKSRDHSVEWKCDKNHYWAATPRTSYKNWCPFCSKKRIHIDHLHEFALKNNGKCLSDEYKSGQKIKWQCEMGHIWFTKKYKPKYWCPHCSNNVKKSIKSAIELANLYSGKCLSTTCNNSKDKLKWQCSNGHIFFKNMYWAKKSWCSECRVLKERSIHIQKAKTIAAERGGLCLNADKYKDCKSKLQWQCLNGHVWKAFFTTIVHQGSWCPECSRFFGEKLTRYILENLYNTKIPKSKPKWLISPKGALLELDGLCMQSKVAFEYNGPQHYKDMFYSKRENLSYRKICDNIKIKKCNERCIKLYIIPTCVNKSFTHTFENIKKHILEQSNFTSNEIDFIIKNIDMNVVNKCC